MYIYICNNILVYSGDRHDDQSDHHDGGVYRGVFCDGDDRVDDPSPYPLPPFFLLLYSIEFL
ncbi:hypothetical protein J2R98_001034 [Alkalibacillus filiformis]|uniref:Uncharacterized protein n=1 Tax=Alkalibacillus filiformis TaxID=200990 RepID=A0ABU0DS10_9BACI|nr:hypothetical protein [Alkalibacillus filiformis]